jgi:hypothetical protein
MISLTYTKYNFLRKFLYTIYFEYETSVEYSIDIRMSGKLLPLELKPADIHIFFILFMNIHKMYIQYIILIFNLYYIKLFKTQERSIPISEVLLL